MAQAACLRVEFSLRSRKISDLTYELKLPACSGFAVCSSAKSVISPGIVTVRRIKPDVSVVVGFLCFLLTRTYNHTVSHWSSGKLQKVIEKRGVNNFRLHTQWPARLPRALPAQSRRG